MTVLTEVSSVIYSGNGVTTAFDTTFPFVDAEDLVVTRILIADASETALVLGTDYSVTGGEYDTGTVTLTAGALAVTYQLRIDRTTPVDQPTDFQPTGEFPIATLERQMDRIVLVQQEQRRDYDNLVDDIDGLATEEYVDDAVAEFGDDVDAAQAAAVAAAASAASAAASLAAFLDGGLASAPVSSAMEPVVAASTLADARTEMGVPGVGDNITFTGNNKFTTGTLTLSNGVTISGTAAAENITGSGTLVMTGATTLNGATKVDDTLEVTGASTLAAVAATTVAASGLVSANAGLNVAGAALNTPAEVDVASASTVNLDTAASNKVRITGTTTITAITLTNGRFRFVRFADVLTFTHGASLVLPGGANITTAAGDCCTVAGEAAGVVRVVDYQKANGLPVASGSGKVAQVVRATWATYTAFTNATPFDNTIPQITEGAERFTAAITPINAGSTLLVEVDLKTSILSVNDGDIIHAHVIGHLHRDADANALAAGLLSHIDEKTALDSGGISSSIRISHAVAAGSTSATTFRVRSGRAVTGVGTPSTLTTSHNGQDGALFGTTYYSSITITEILP